MHYRDKLAFQVLMDRKERGDCKESLASQVRTHSMTIFLWSFLNTNMKKKKNKTEQTHCFFFTVSFFFLNLQVQRAHLVTLGSKAKWETEDTPEKRVNEKGKLLTLSIIPI